MSVWYNVDKKWVKIPLFPELQNKKNIYEPYQKNQLWHYNRQMLVESFENWMEPPSNQLVSLLSVLLVFMLESWCVVKKTHIYNKNNFYAFF